MFGLDTLDIMIGLATIYLVFGLACTAIVEAIISWFGIRSTNLEDAMKELLAGQHRQGESFVDAFYKHPMIQALSKGEDGRPSYIPPKIFSQVVEALVFQPTQDKSANNPLELLPGTVNTNRIKGLLDPILNKTRGTAEHFRIELESQFDAAMDRASGWFKRYAQNASLLVATVLVLGANVDTVAIINALSSNPDARIKLVEAASLELNQAEQRNNTLSAEEKTDKSVVSVTQERIRDAQNRLEDATLHLSSTGLELGWKTLPHTFSEILSKIAGLLISIVAISLGAPFWFSLLQRFMQVRAAGISPEEKATKKTAPTTAAE